MQLFSIVFSSNVDSFFAKYKILQISLYKWVVSVNSVAGPKYGDGSDHSCSLDGAYGGYVG